MSWFSRNQTHDAWREAPLWARKMRDLQLSGMAQNEAILAKLEDRPCKNSPADQAMIDQIFDVAKDITTKEDAALKT